MSSEKLDQKMSKYSDWKQEKSNGFAAITDQGQG